MERILEKLEKMNEFNSRKEEYDLKAEEIKQENKELEKLNEKVKLTALGSQNRVVAQKNYEDKKRQLEDAEKAMSEINEKNQNEFEVQKNEVINAIDEEISKYKSKEELDNLVSQKNAYSKMVENSKKDIEKIIAEINEGKDVDISRLKSARGELKENSQKIEEIEKELEKYKVLEDNQKVVSDLNYLKMRVQSMNFGTMKNIKEDEFFKEYGKDIDDEKLDLEENEENKDEEENKDNQEKTGTNRRETKNETSKGGRPGGSSTKNKIILVIDENKIKINNNNDLFYKKEAKNKEKLDKLYSIKSYFITNKEQKKNIDYSLVSALSKIDDKENSLVEAYLNVIIGGGLSGKSLEESIQKINESVDISYKFNTPMGLLAKHNAKKFARNANRLGIATLDGINEKGLWGTIKDKFSKLKNIKLLSGKEKQKALDSGEKTNAQKDIEKVKQLINEDRENLGKQAEVFHSRYEANDNVKENIDEVSKKYKKLEEEAEENRAKDVENIKNKEKIHKLTPDEYEEISPDK